MPELKGREIESILKDEIAYMINSNEGNIQKKDMFFDGG